MMTKRKIFYLFLWMSIPLTPILAQEQLTLRERADALFLRYEYAQAALLYEQLADRRSPRLHDLERAAESYYYMREFEQSERWYKHVVSHEDRRVEHMLTFADVLKANGKYEEAKNYYRDYLSQGGVDDLVSIKIAGCDSAMVWKSNPADWVIRHEDAVNTEQSEFSVSVVNEQIFFAGEARTRADSETYGWTGRPYLKLFETTLSAEGKLEAPRMASADLNDLRYHVGPLASPDGGNTLYVTQTFAGDALVSSKEQGNRFRVRRLELYIYRLVDGEWKGTPFLYNAPDQYSVGHAAFSPTGDVLYFVSDRPGGYGGTDIWFSKLESDGTWGEPINAGPSINTPGDELFPVIGADDRLYYSTDGLAGMGGLDVFFAEGNETQWTEPTNLGFPINSSADDFSMLVVHEDDENVQGYLASNRSGGSGGDDIYSIWFEKPQAEPIVLVLKGVVSEKHTRDVLSNAQVVLANQRGEEIAKASSSQSGTFEFSIEPGTRYRVHSSLDKFLPDTAFVDTESIVQSDTLYALLELERELAVGITFVLENLYYDFDQHTIRPDAAEVLDKLVNIMRANPTLKIELSSHTDSRGSDAYNMALSVRRAEAAVAYLISRGVAEDRMIAKGYGETRLVNDCSNGVPCTEEQHQANRRTEVTILER